MTLDELANKEHHLLKKIADFEGDNKLMSQYFEGIFTEYEMIHRQYVDIAVVDSDIEALKRAIFIQWFRRAEPPFLSGINRLDESAELLALDELQKLESVDQVDEEFTWMLKCYYQVADIFIAPRSRYGTLVKYLEKLPAWNPLDAKKYSFHHRGQMGDYWISRIDKEIL